MSRPTQTERLLRMLDVAGPSGLTQLDMFRPLDGGPPIMALSQRIGDLRRQGHAIDVETIATAGGARCARYRLAGAMAVAPARGTVPANPPTGRCNARPAQPEDGPLVHSTRSPEPRA